MGKAWIPVVIAALAPGCGDRSVATDSGVDQQVAADWRWSDLLAPDVRPTDMAVPPDLGRPTRREMVISRLLLPDGQMPPKLGHDYNGDGSVDNALGSVLGAVAGMTGGSPGIQQALEQMTNSGAALHLLRMSAADFVSDPGASVQAYVAGPTTCCTAPQDPALCAAQAQATCFSGSHMFSLSPSDPNGSLLAGAIKGGTFVFGPAPFKLALPLLGSKPLVLQLKAAYLEGSLSGSAIPNGVLSGGISQTDLQNQLIPALALALDALLKDPGTDPQNKNILISLFDANNDGSISVAELSGSSIVKTFLSGDVDVDGDGVMELSLGLGFYAVGAVIGP